jgi:hypothetical protein
MRYLVVGPDGNIVHGDGDLDAAALKVLVGGQFEVLPSPDGIEATVLASTTAKMEGRPANHPATRLLQTRLRPEDFIAGTVVVTGSIASDGTLTDIDAATEKAVMERIAL